MNILALDLGLNTGAAWGLNDSEAWDLEANVVRHERARRYLDPCAQVFWNLLMHRHAAQRLDCIVFEDVQFGKSLCQVQLWSSFRGVLWAFAHYHFISIECLETWKLKQFATGTPHASKCAMARALVNKNPTVYTLEEEVRKVKGIRMKFAVARRISSGTLLSDDEVDAIHLYTWAKNYIQV